MASLLDRAQHVDKLPRDGKQVMRASGAGLIGAMSQLIGGSHNERIDPFYSALMRQVARPARRRAWR